MQKLKRASVAVKWRKSVLLVEANELYSRKAQDKPSSNQFDKFVSEGLASGLSLKRDYFGDRGTLLEITNI